MDDHTTAETTVPLKPSLLRRLHHSALRFLVMAWVFFSFTMSMFYFRLLAQHPEEVTISDTAMANYMAMYLAGSSFMLMFVILPGRKWMRDGLLGQHRLIADAQARSGGKGMDDATPGNPQSNDPQPRSTP